MPLPASPEPVFGGLTATPSLPEAGFGVFVGAAVGGTGVFVLGAAVLVAVGVCVRSFPRVGSAAGAVGVGHRPSQLPALTTPNDACANPKASTPATTIAAPIDIHLFDFTASPPEPMLFSNT